MINPINDINQLCQITADLIEAQARQDIPPGKQWFHDANTLTLKFFNHVSSVCVLSQGTEFSSSLGQNTKFIDFASLSLIARAALENYIVFCYIYDAKNPERSEYRHLTWQMCGLMDRQKYKSDLPKNKQQQKSEGEKISKMMARVIADPNFQKLKPHEQKRLVKGEWRMDSQWIDLAVDSGLDRQYFLNIYKHLCGYSHSGYLSTLQIRDNWKSYEGQLEMTERITGIICSVLAHFIYVYCEFFPAAHEALQAQPDQKFIASLWRTTPEDWANYYKNRQDQ